MARAWSAALSSVSETGSSWWSTSHVARFSGVATSSVPSSRSSVLTKSRNVSRPAGVVLVAMCRRLPLEPHHQTSIIGYNNHCRDDIGYEDVVMMANTLPELIWLQASVCLPERMLQGLKRWVILGTMW